MTLTKADDEESIPDVKLNDLHLLYSQMNKKDSYLSLSSSPESEPVRIPSLFSQNRSFLSVPLNKREKKAEINKLRSLSHDVSGIKLTCKCCGKEETNIPTTYDETNSDSIHLCTRCSSALHKKQDYARTFNGTAKISSKGSNMVEYTCEKGHTWTANIHRAYKSWCSTCRKLFREERKQHFKRQSSKIRQENADRQKELFTEAQAHYLSDSQSDSSFTYEHFEDIFNSILPIAKVKADDFISQNEASPPCTYEQALCVYKVLEADASRAMFILNGMDASSKKYGYKKLAMTLHPDKNRHPLSKEAFQKASELFTNSS